MILNYLTSLLMYLTSPELESSILVIDPTTTARVQLQPYEQIDLYVDSRQLKPNTEYIV